MRAPSSVVAPFSREERADQRNAVIACFLGWTLDAFDFFILTFVIDDIARSFGKTRPQIALAITGALAMRPLGAIVFGIMADRWGRRRPLMLNVIFYAVISVLSGFAPTYQVFLALRMLFGVGMGGEWGIGASLALESAPARFRGLLSGLLQEGYAFGNLLAAIAFLVAYPLFEAQFPGNGWRLMFALGGVPGLLSLFIRAKVKESAAWREHRTDWPTYRTSIFQHGRRFAYLVLLMTAMNFIAHGTQDVYPTLLRASAYSPKQVANVIALSMIGAIAGGLIFGYYSDRVGRRRAMISAIACAFVVVPFWVAAHNAFLIVTGVFLMQFFVQGAWGVIPAHINELTPGHLRGFFPGFAYQLGVLCASGIPYIESTLGERFSYPQAMGGLVAIVLIGGIFVTMLGPEARGITFRKSA